MPNDDSVAATLTATAPPGERRAALLNELEHRRDKQWKIFSWVASIFVASIAGLVALRLGDPPAHFSTLFCGAVTMAAIGLQAYATLWIRQNWRLELKALKQLHDLGIDLPTNDQKASYHGERKAGLLFGYLQALFLVFLALVAVVWMDTLGHHSPPSPAVTPSTALNPSE